MSPGPPLEWLAPSASILPPPRNYDRGYATAMVYPYMKDIDTVKSIPGPFSKGAWKNCYLFKCDRQLISDSFSQLITAGMQFSVHYCCLVVTLLHVYVNKTLSGKKIFETFLFTSLACIW